MNKRRSTRSRTQAILYNINDKSINFDDNQNKKKDKVTENKDITLEDMEENKLKLFNSPKNKTNLFIEFKKSDDKPELNMTNKQVDNVNSNDFPVNTQNVIIKSIDQCDKTTDNTRRVKFITENNTEFELKESKTKLNLENQQINNVKSNDFVAEKENVTVKFMNNDDKTKHDTRDKKFSNEENLNLKSEKCKSKILESNNLNKLLYILLEKKYISDKVQVKDNEFVNLCSCKNLEKNQLNKNLCNLENEKDYELNNSNLFKNKIQIKEYDKILFNDENYLNEIYDYNDLLFGKNHNNFSSKMYETKSRHLYNYVVNRLANTNYLENTNMDYNFMNYPTNQIQTSNLKQLPNNFCINAEFKKNNESKILRKLEKILSKVRKIENALIAKNKK